MSKYFKSIEDNMNVDFLNKLDEAREYAVGFTRIGIANSFIHVDLDFDKSQNVIWTY